MYFFLLGFIISETGSVLRVMFIFIVKVALKSVTCTEREKFTD